METTTTDQVWRPLLEAMIERLKEAGTLSDLRVEEALRAVPRHEFLTGDAEPEEAYSGDLLRVLASPDGGTLSTISDVRSVVGLLQVLDLAPGERALEIGLATGFNAALMAHLASPGKVTSIDSEDVLVAKAKATLERLGVDNIVPIAADGWLGDPSSAPFDAMLATVGVSDISPHWAQQLCDGGRMLVPLWISATVRPGVLFTKHGETLDGRVLGTQRYVMLKGRGLDTLGDWVFVGDDYWTLRDASVEAWEILTRLLDTGPTVEHPLEIEDSGWPWWSSWLGFEDPDVFVTIQGLTGLFDMEKRGLVVVDPRDRAVRGYGHRDTYGRLMELVVRRRPESPVSFAGRTLSELTIEAVPSGSGVNPPNGWLVSREHYDFVVRLPPRS